MVGFCILPWPRDLHVLRFVFFVLQLTNCGYDSVFCHHFSALETGIPCFLAVNYQVLRYKHETMDLCSCHGKTITLITYELLTDEEETLSEYNINWVHLSFNSKEITFEMLISERQKSLIFIMSTTTTTNMDLSNVLQFIHDNCSVKNQQ